MPAAAPENKLPNPGIDPATSSPIDSPFAFTVWPRQCKAFCWFGVSSGWFPLFAATTGPDAVFPAHSGNPNASVDLDHSMPRYRAGFLVANPRREFSLSCAIAARDNSGIAVRKAESMYCPIVRLWGRETERILVGFYGSLSSDSSSDSASRAANKSSVVGSPGWVSGAIVGSASGAAWCSSVAAG